MIAVILLAALFMSRLSHGFKKCELGEPSSVHIGNFSYTLVFTYC